MAETVHKQALPAGHRIGGYRVERVLGVGGFGVTYLAEHASLGHRAAVKEYLPSEFAVRDGTKVHPKSEADRADFEWGLERFVEEARTLARFGHRSIVPARDLFEANRTAYLVMDYEDGEPLDRLLERRGRLTEAQLLRVVLPIADGLREIHAAGFLHRDVKPSNVYVRRSDESPVLLDFGAARQALGRRSKSLTAVVSAGYSPPEQYESEGEQGPWTDVYALSALCYRAITGKVPVDAPRRQGMLLRGRSDPLPRLTEHPPAGYSPVLLNAVDRGLSVIETERNRSLDEWSVAVQDGAAGRVSAHRFDGAPRMHGHEPGADRAVLQAASRPHRRGRLAALAAAAVGAVRRLHPAHEMPAPDDSGDESVATVPTSASPELAMGYIAGVDAYKSGDFMAALCKFRTLAEQGNAYAQAALGYMYANGQGVAEDDVQAFAWFRKAAEQGDVWAQGWLGCMYDLGAGVAKDEVQAAVWSRKAAEQGAAWACRELGHLYEIGRGIAKSDVQAATWYRKAAEQGDAWAQERLAYMYLNSLGVTKDFTQAAAWFRKAADQGEDQSNRQTGIMHHRGQSPHAISIASEKSQRRLGIMYANGEGVAKDDEQAAMWFRKAAEQGDTLAQYRLGCMYASGEGVREDSLQAYVWLTLVAELPGETPTTKAARLKRDSVRQGMTAVQLAEARNLSRTMDTQIQRRSEASAAADISQLAIIAHQRGLVARTKSG